ncbi:hypothetical protein BD779DRAFT_1446858, partial [Infundibulicybe gibba]
KKYKAYLAALQEHQRLSSPDDWSGSRPPARDIVEVFFSRSMFYSHYRKFFAGISHYPMMYTWLEQEGKGPLTNLEVWGVNLTSSSYKFSHLEAWIANGETLIVDINVNKEDKKGKDKGKGKGKGKGKDEEGPKKRAHKKNMIMRVPVIIWIIIMLSTLPSIAAKSPQAGFPDVKFSVFSEFVATHFSSKVSLATVLLVLFSMLDNPDLLTLHFRQKHPICDGENKIQISGWIKALVRGLQNKLGNRTRQLFKKSEFHHPNHADHVTPLAMKIDLLAELLKLTPYNDEGEFQGRLQLVSYDAIQSVQTICPASYICEDMNCEPRALLQDTRIRDIPLVTLIKGSKIHEKVSVLTGKCPKYNGHLSRVYLNSAPYLKVGQSTWVDREFSNAVLNGMYSFHASASAYTEFWNNSYGNITSKNPVQLTRRHVWQAFVQESIRTVAAESEIHLELRDNISINDVTSQAFDILGNSGKIGSAKDHTCSECTQDYRIASENAMDIDYALVNMVVLDGIVMGPTHCAYDDCTSDLNNSRGGSFCSYHENLYGVYCHVRGCQNRVTNQTKACEQHQKEWSKYTQHHSRQHLAGVRRMLQRPGTSMPWETGTKNIQPHDEDSTEYERKNYFGPGRFYCVETVCAPCGVVIAWAKFAKSESPTNILQFLKAVYPTEESRPNYICIDKACLVLRTSVANGSWDMWKKTSRFIVDSYHYINHRTTDGLCRKYCNPAPLDGSAPNLVVIAYDDSGQPYYKRAYNTQACEQLNAWLGGFESILKRMTPGNFSWFLHVMLFYHTKYVLQKQKQKGKAKADLESDDNGEM